MRPLLRYIAVALLMIAAPAVAFAQDEQLADRQVLRDGMPDDDITGLDPLIFLNSSTEPLVRAMYEGLVRFNFGNVSPELMEPALAERWETSEDGLNWTFYLRQGVQFHKGFGEFTAEDVKFTIERNQSEGSRVAGDYANVESVVVVDPYTVEFNLKAPDAFFLFTVGNYQGGFMVSKAAVESLGLEGFRTNPVGTGPFQFEEWIPRERVVLVRNEDYWRGAPILEAVEAIFMPDVNARTLALLQGEIDAMSWGIDDEQWVRSMEAQGVTVDILGFDVPMMLHLNLTVEPLNDLRVRRALAHATNKEDFIAFHGPAITRVQDSPLPPTMYGYLSPEEGLPTYEYNPEKARELLADAGYPNGLDLGTILSSVRPLYLDPLEVVQGQWAEVGVTFDIQTYAHNEYQALIRQDLSPIVGYPGARATPHMILFQYLHSNSIMTKDTGITNFSHYGDVDADGDGTIDSIDDLIIGALTSLDPDPQREMYARAQIQMMEDLPVIPLRVLAAVRARQSWVDLGYPPYEGSYMNGYAYNELTRILQH